MTDRFMSAVLAALNETSEIKPGDWNSIEIAQLARIPVGAALRLDVTQASENRFAVTISIGMEKIRQFR